MANVTANNMANTPLAVSIVPSSLVGGLIIVLMLGGFGAWATMANLAGAVVASGVVAVDSNRKTIQHLEGGIVADILVSEGHEVEKDQLLVRLDDTRAATNLANINAQIDVFLARLTRLRAEQESRSDIGFHRVFQDRLEEAVVAQMMTGQTALFHARREALAGEISLLAQRKAQYQNQIKGLEAQVIANKEIAAILRQELATSRKLYERGNLALTPILELERSLAQSRGYLGEFQADIAIAKGSIAEMDLEILQLQMDFRESVETELLEVQAKIFDLNEQRIMASHEHNRIEIRAPKAGKVLDLGVHTIGGVITPGQAILDIVPKDDELIIEANIEPQDIDKVVLGQDAIVRLSAFDLRTTPELDGYVDGVSADSFLHETNGNAYYKLRIRIPASELAKLDNLTLLPGMPTEIFVQTEHRTPLSYLMKPLTDSAMRAFRED